MSNDYLEKLLQSKKYRDVCPDTINRIWSVCAAKYKKPKDADRARRREGPTKHEGRGRPASPLASASLSEALW